MERLHYLETGSTDPAYNLAFEEYVLTHRMDGDYLILWQNDNTVVVGQNQNTAAEINRAFVEAHGVHVVRRTTGGGAVYHDLGNLNYSFITDEEAGSLRLERFTAPVVDALASLGLQAEASGPQRYPGRGPEGLRHGPARVQDPHPAPRDAAVRLRPGHGGGRAERRPGEIPVQGPQIRPQPHRQHPLVFEARYDAAGLLGAPAREPRQDRCRPGAADRGGAGAGAAAEGGEVRHLGVDLRQISPL